MKEAIIWVQILTSLNLLFSGRASLHHHASRSGFFRKAPEWISVRAFLGWLSAGAVSFRARSNIFHPCGCVFGRVFGAPLTFYFLFSLFAVWTLLLAFLSWHSNCIPIAPDHSWLIHPQELFRLEPPNHDPFWVLFLPYPSVSEGTATLRWFLLSFLSSHANWRAHFPACLSFLHAIVLLLPVCMPC